MLFVFALRFSQLTINCKGCALMIILVAGSRNWSDGTLIQLIVNRLRALPADTLIIHGACQGVDTHAGLIARKLGLRVQEFRPQWSIYGPPAGPIRNLKMLNAGPDRVVCFHDNLAKSKGTRHLIKHANARRIPVELWTSKNRHLNFWLRGV